MLKVDSLFKALDRSRVRAVEHVQFREPIALAESSAKDLGAEAAAAHPEQHNVCETVIAHALAESRKLVGCLDQLVDDSHPPQRVADDLLVVLFGLPEARVFIPDAPNPLLALRALDRLFDLVGVRAERRGLPFEYAARDRGLFRRDAPHQGAERIGE